MSLYKIDNITTLLKIAGYECIVDYYVEYAKFAIHNQGSVLYLSGTVQEVVKKAIEQLKVLNGLRPVGDDENE